MAGEISVFLYDLEGFFQIIVFLGGKLFVKSFLFCLCKKLTGHYWFLVDKFQKKLI